MKSPFYEVLCNLPILILWCALLSPLDYSYGIFYVFYPQARVTPDFVAVSLLLFPTTSTGKITTKKGIRRHKPVTDQNLD